jgi:hypothetical protein
MPSITTEVACAKPIRLCRYSRTAAAWWCAVIVLGLACASLASTPPGLKRRFQEYRRAYSRHDVQAVLSFLADDYVFRVANSDYKASKKELVGNLEWDFALNARTAYEDLQLRGNTIRVIIIDENDFYKGLGLVGPRKYRFRYEYDEKGQIKEGIIEQYLTDPEEFTKAFNALTEWAKKERPQELAEIFPNNHMEFKKELAGRWIALMREWHKAKR